MSRYAPSLASVRIIYSLKELSRVLDRVGLSLAGVYDDQGLDCAPTARQWELYVEARRD